VTSGARIAFDLPRAAQLSLDVYDVRGARVRSLRDEFVAAGPGVAVWDGRDDRGHLVAGGTYLVRLRWPSGTEVRRITVVR